MIIISFLFFIGVFLIIGLLSARHKQSTNMDYFLARQEQPPWLVSLSAVATNNSGYMFIGLIGFTYTVGVSSIWIMVGWIGGDFLASLFVHKKLRIHTTKTQEITFAGVLANWHGTNYKKARFFAGVITFVFLGIYAAAQLSAGGKALHVLFGWNYSIGILIGAVIVMVYCFAGGIRASIWTDAAQSFVMITSMFLILVLAAVQFGSVGALYQAMKDVSDSYMNILPPHRTWGFSMAAFLLGWFAVGYGVVGQPHIMIRFMTMKDENHMTRVRLYYYSWHTAFTIITVAVGLAARTLLPHVVNFDPELALPTLSLHLLPKVLVGFVLAGLFSATMSTADSQILSCSATVTQDLTGGLDLKYHWSKVSTLIVSIFIISVALFGDKNVFSLVVLAWSVLAASFAPVLTVYVFNGKPSERTVLAMMIAGFACVIAFNHTGITDYKVPFGMFFAFAIFGCSLLLQQLRSSKENPKA